MFDGITRLVLLAAIVITSIRGLWILRMTRWTYRRWALVAMMPAQLLLIWFYIDNLLTKPFFRPVPGRPNMILRTALLGVIVGWWVKQDVIRIAEKTLPLTLDSE